MNIDSPSNENHRRSATAIAIILSVLVVSGLLLAYLLHRVDWEIVRRTGPSMLVPILALTVLGTMAYTALIYVLVRGSGHTTTLWKAYLVLTASLSANYITPVKMGMPLRIYLYDHFMAVPVATGVALVTVETLVGMLVPAFITVAGIALLFPSLGLTTPIILIALLLTGLFLVQRAKIKHLYPLIGRWHLPRFILRLARFVEHIQTGMRSLRSTTILGVAVLDVLMLVLQAGRLWFVLNIFGYALPLPTLLAILAISVTAGNLSMLPMGLGVRDASFTLLLAQQGVPDEVALAAAVIQRLFAPGWPLLLGIISANILGVSELTKRSDDTLVVEAACQSDTPPNHTDLN